MTKDQRDVLEALYMIETERLDRSDYDAWSTPAEIAAALTSAHRGDATWTRRVLEGLWIERKVLQIPESEGEFVLEEAWLRDEDAYGDTDCRIPVERNDVRTYDGHPWERVAIYPASVHVKFRSRVAEIARLLSRNYQRFRMLPSTGLVRYVRRPQLRPEYRCDIAGMLQRVEADIDASVLRIERSPGDPQPFPLDPLIHGPTLKVAVRAVLEALAGEFAARGRPSCLADFQVRSIVATLGGLYCAQYRSEKDGHVVTAGVGSGKSFAFQIGALIHVAYRALRGEPGIRVLLLYPRVVLAENQFQELVDLVAQTATRIGIPLAPPELDAGGRLGRQDEDGKQRGYLFGEIRRVYGGISQILISNLDTIANRLDHPEAADGLVRDLELVVLDEVHLLSGLYGAHTRMFLKRLSLVRSLRKLRSADPSAPFADLMERRGSVPAPYFVAASATIAEPARHVGRLLDTEASRILHMAVEAPLETGWIHHLFLRQRPETSSTTAAINAVACLIHNRREGLYHEYYERAGGGELLRLDEIPNPVQLGGTVVPRQTRSIHKTLAFSDSLDGVNRWADLTADNERVKAEAMASSPNPAASALPYFARFQEPLWRTVHQSGFGRTTPRWHQRVFDDYGNLCRDCKRGIKRRIDRVPAGLSQAQRDALEKLWDCSPNNEDSYLSRLNIDPAHHGSSHFAAVVAASQVDHIGTLDECGFFSAGLCWWWSHDHLGSNHPTPAAGNDPVNGFKKPQPGASEKYMPLNAVRLRSFTSKTSPESTDSINDVFRGPANSIFRSNEFPRQATENCALVIGSPRIEVGVDLARVNEGVTFRAMRDPASLQQKVGRVGRELFADSIAVHIVTENARDHFYFRNPRIVLDPDFLQPIPLHENNDLVARNHYFMAIFDFLCLQGTGPTSGRIANDGDRLLLINDHKNARPFSGWDRKVAAVYDFLFGTHPKQVQNLANLGAYLQALGASGDAIASASMVALTPQDAPLRDGAGAIDVFRHEFGPNFLLTPLPPLPSGLTITIAQLCASPNAPPPYPPGTLPPRHREFIRTYHNESAYSSRSYLHEVLRVPIFRRGIPLDRIPGDQPFLWTPNFYDAVAREFTVVFEETIAGQRRDIDPEPTSLALVLLSPGTVTYRYKASPRKVPVAKFGAMGIREELPGLVSVKLDVLNPEFFDPVGCPDIDPNDLPGEFQSEYLPVPVYLPRQIGLIPAQSAPNITRTGVLADGDEAPFGPSPGLGPLATPPRCYALRWYRIVPSRPTLAPPPCRLASRFRQAGGAAVSPLPLPSVMTLFARIGYDPELKVTQFVWGLDRQFMTRQVAAARLIYRDSDQRRVAIGQHFRTAGLRFPIDLRPGTPMDGFLDELIQHEESGAHQAVLGHVLYRFLAENARTPPPDDAPVWMEPTRPSVFVARNLRTLVFFHLLERWHPTATAASPTGPIGLRLADLVGCFTTGDPAFIDAARFRTLCRWIATVQNPPDVNARIDSLVAAYPNFENACQRVANLDGGYVRTTCQELVLNGLGITLHAAALRLTGAETHDLAYFYRRHDDAESEIFLFDTDEQGNGTSDLVRDTFYVSPIERILTARERALGGTSDPLPTTDLVSCFEDALQECENSQASHLAMHNLPADVACTSSLDSARRGERLIAGRLFDFVRSTLGISSFDRLLPLQACPEFLAHVSTYPGHGPPLVPSAQYPTFQALESAAGFCIDGCVSCVVAPEQNIHGILAAKETVSKLVLDALYRRLVVESPAPEAALRYPGIGVGRTVAWDELAGLLAGAMGQSLPGTTSFTVELDGSAGPVSVTVIPATSLGPWDRVFRPSWDPAPPPADNVRPRMPI